MATYNGHRNWDYWNVSLWIANEEPLYRLALDCMKRSRTLTGAANLFISRLGKIATPDGAEYTMPRVRSALAQLRD